MSTVGSPAAGRPGFTGIDDRVLRSPAYDALTALERSVLLSLYRLANITEQPWIHHGRRLGVVRRGELTWTLRNIAADAKVSLDVAKNAVKKLMRAGFLDEVLAAVQDPTSSPTTQPTADPTYKPTTPRKLTLRYFLGNGDAGRAEPTTEPTKKPTTQPPSDPTEYRCTDVQTEQIERAPSAPTALAGAPARKAKPADPRHATVTAALVAEYERLRGVKYAFNRAADPPAITSLLKRGPDEQILAAWRAGVVAAPPFRCDTIAQLASPRIWNRLARPTAAEPTRRPLAATSDARWANTRAELQRTLRADLFDRWIAPLRGEGRGEDLVIEAPDEFAASFIADNYREVLTNAAREFGPVTGLVHIAAARPAGAAA